MKRNSCLYGKFQMDIHWKNYFRWSRICLKKNEEHEYDFYLFVSVKVYPDQLRRNECFSTLVGSIEITLSRSQDLTCDQIRYDSRSRNYLSMEYDWRIWQTKKCIFLKSKCLRQVDSRMIFLERWDREKALSGMSTNPGMMTKYSF